ncbi:MAG: copper amine oxidase N-terminal domain-containing protein [Clostridia bacterium]|nr:copper amine oxidase N-terminal domain-containing protein [Clostridia bacterium]
MKKLKVLISLLCMAALAAGSFPSIGFAQEDEITVIVDTVALNPADGKAQIVGEGTTMVPFRSIFEALGFEVDFFPKSGTITTVIGFNEEKDIIVGLTVGSDVIYVCSYAEYLNNGGLFIDSRYVTVEEKVFIDETGRTLIPARAVSEALGADVVWAAGSNTVIIMYSDERYYSDTDIPRYEYVTGDAYTSVSTDAYGNPLYVYPYPNPVEKFNKDYAVDTLINGAGFAEIDSNLDDDNKATILYESQANNCLLIQANMGENILNIIPYSNKVYPYYITGLSGTGVTVAALPNYTYFTKSECLSWAEDDDGSGDHVYKYKYNYEEVNYYFGILENMGYECYFSSGSVWHFKNGSLYVNVEVDATLGYIYIAPFVGSATFKTEYYYDDGSTYYNTDIPTFYGVTGIEPSNIEYDSDYGAVEFTYVCTDSEYRAYVRELEAKGFKDVSGSYTILESPKNKYIIVIKSGSYLYVMPFDNLPTYLGTYVPNYTYVTEMECLFWFEDDDGDPIYCYPYSQFDWDTYCTYLTNRGYEEILSVSVDGGAVVYMSDGSHIVRIVALDLDGTTYLAITPWVMEDAS